MLNIGKYTLYTQPYAYGGRPCVRVEVEGEPYCNLTANLPDYHLHMRENEICIDPDTLGYCPNLIQLLVDEGVIEFTPTTFMQGYAFFRVARLLKEI